MTEKPNILEGDGDTSSEKQMSAKSLKDQLEHNLAIWPRWIIGFGFAAVLSFIIVLAIYVYNFYGTPSPDQEVWGQFGDFLGGVLNPLFSVAAFLGLLLTIMLQLRALKISSDELELTRTELAKTALANQTIAEDNKANAIVDLYQIYTNDYFYELSRAAWKVLEIAVKDYDYCNFLVSTFFVTEYKSPRLDDDLLDKIKTHFDSHEDVKRLENDYRHRLDEMINFFNIIALRNAPKEVFEKCDFFYDWYRPLLWWICDLRLSAYMVDENKQRYCTSPSHHKGLKILDSVYGFETGDRLERWEEFQVHPLITQMGLDRRHGYPFEDVSQGEDNESSDEI